MKKYLNYSLSYGVMGLVCGVYFREFTKIMGFSGVTTLSKAHPHLLMLGTILFLIVALFSERLILEKEKTFTLFMRIYNIGLPLTVLMMLIRGTLEVIGEGCILRTAVIFFYVSNEGVSILENAARLGLPVPEKMKAVLEQLHSKGDKEIEKEDDE